jgi:Primase C terminal 2 (PriCT-2)/RepB DNA-primase from phage plasmid
MRSKLQIDLAQARMFLAALDSAGNDFTFATFSDGKGKVRSRNALGNPHAAILHGRLKELSSDLETRNNQGAGVFVTVNEMDGRGRKIENFKRVRAVWVDLDQGLPDKSWPLEPSIVVESSPSKLHVYWLVNDEMPLATFRQVMVRLIRDWKGDPRATDPTRVLRLPGFCHVKTDAPHLVRIVAPPIERVQNGDVLRYSTQKIVEVFPPAVRRLSRVGKPTFRTTTISDTSLDVVRSALNWLAEMPAETGEAIVDDRNLWFRFGAAIKREYGDDGFEIWDTWSQKSPKYDAANSLYVWKSIDLGSYSGTPVTLGTIFHLARQHGWTRPRTLSAPLTCQKPEGTG